jgi:AmmeMemoRadiSam system protein A
MKREYMTTITDEDRAALLKLARSSIEAKLIKEVKVIRPEKKTSALEENRGCFVTLHKNGALRGCIGTIEAIKPLVNSVEENALNAAFRDPRFASLEEEELKYINIEISVLTVPQELSFKDKDDLKRKIKKGVHGIILSSGWHKATFLPQVWEQLPDVENFLEHLCIKAGIKKDCWKNRTTRVQTYETEFFSEPS